MEKAKVLSSRARPHSIHLCRVVETPRTPDEVYAYLTTRMGASYTRMAKGHVCFDVVGGGGLVEGCTIDCRESAGNQEVHHQYHVKKLVPGEHVYYASTPSRSFVHLKRRSIEGRADTHVYYDLQPGSDSGTRLTMTIVIELPGRGARWMARLGGADRVWGRHQREELEGLVRLLDAA